MRRTITITAFLLVLLIAVPVLLEAQTRLVPARDVVELREVWRREGIRFTDDEWGRQTWGGTDLNGDSIADFGVYRGSTNEWYFFAGGPQPDTAAMWVVDSVASRRPLFGDFSGDGELEVVFVSGRSEVINATTYYFAIVEHYAWSDTGLVSEPIDTNELRALQFVEAVELDGRPGLDLIIGWKFPGSDQFGMIEIYPGGPDFQIREPSIVVVDTFEGRSPAFDWRVEFRDFDGDGFTDLLTGGGYPGLGEAMRFYWGDANSPQSWTERDFDRTVKLVHGVHGINSHADLNLFDADGDGAVDFGSREYDDQYGSRLYLSGTGKSVRTRSFELDDADRFYENALIDQSMTLGRVNDSTGRYDIVMFDFIDPSSVGNFGVSGGAWGPDHDYEVVAPKIGNARSVEKFSSVLPDVTGDGWPDLLGEQYQLQGGISILYAGGPYIPFDDPTVSVRTEAVAGDPRGLYLWPNPVEDVLRIAWKGNLDRMPVRYEVYDAGGRTVGSGDLDSWKGSGEWRCAGMPAGTYRIVLLDTDEEVIGSAGVVVR